ncbi:hypothetical protein glysoja_034210 [Glycine soja]|uniref:Uncharacterized protein n=1 Tax=Glycine soja TaxID=3848 RepID=A0A0B2SWD6_GLYSO|nr:hypothetical protein glysoja_034210 [Glycine soja]
MLEFMVIIHRLLGDGSDLIDKICKKIPQHRIECTNILRADPRVQRAKNLLEFSEAVLKLALKKGIEGQKFLKGYWSALSELIYDSLTAIFANNDAKHAAYGPEYCETALTSVHIVNLAISILNHQISSLSFIAFLAINQLAI